MKPTMTSVTYIRATWLRHRRFLSWYYTNYWLPPIGSPIGFPSCRSDDVQIVSRVRSSRVKSSSLILILKIVKKELSCTGVVPATESPMSKLEWVSQEKVVLGMCQCVCVFVCFLTLFPSEASVYIYLQAFFSFVRWNIKGDIHSLFVTSRRWATGELFFQRQQRGINVP